MHELGLARSIAGIAVENSKGRALKEVRVAIGPLACVERGALVSNWVSWMQMAIHSLFEN